MESYKKFLARLARETKEGQRERLKPYNIGMKPDGTLDLVADPRAPKDQMRTQ
jgi:hypothetical protein